MITTAPRLGTRRLFCGPLLTALIAIMAGETRLPAQERSPQQVLAAMDKCREQVIAGLSFSDKMKMKAALGAIQGDPRFVAANKADFVDEAQVLA